MSAPTEEPVVTTAHARAAAESVEAEMRLLAHMSGEVVRLRAEQASITVKIGRLERAVKDQNEVVAVARERAQSLASRATERVGAR